MARFTVRSKKCAAVLLSALCVVACDDGGSGEVTVDAEADRGPGLVDVGDTQDAAVADVGDPDVEVIGDDAGQGPELPCDENSNFGLLAPSVAAFEGGPLFAPEAVWDGSSYAVTWLTPSEEPSLNTVNFGTFDRDGAPIGDPVELGNARSSNHRIAMTGQGFAVAWKNARTVGGGFDGIKLQLFATDGTAAGDSVEVQGTFDVNHMSMGWAAGTTGMIAYTRGDSGAGGLFVLPIDETGTPGNPVQVSETRAQSPAIAYGDGGWGIAWLDFESENPADLLFQLLNDGGGTLSAVRRQSNAGAQGGVRIGFGGGTFGVGWSKLDPMGTLKPFITLVDSAGDVLATPPVAGPQGFGLVTGVTWLDPDNFGVVWQDTRSDGVSVGVSRVNPNGVVLGALTLTPPEGSQYRSMTLAGNVSRAGAWFTADPNPPVGGGFSPEAHLELGVLGPCR